MSSFQAHDLLRIDCNVKAKQGWMRDSFKAHNLFENWLWRYSGTDMVDDRVQGS